MTSRSKPPRERQIFRATYKRVETSITDPKRLAPLKALCTPLEPFEVQVLAAGQVERGPVVLEYRDVRIYMQAKS